MIVWIDGQPAQSKICGSGATCCCGVHTTAFLSLPFLKMTDVTCVSAGKSLSDTFMIHRSRAYVVDFIILFCTASVVVPLAADWFAKRKKGWGGGRAERWWRLPVAGSCLTRADPPPLPSEPRCVSAPPCSPIGAIPLRLLGCCAARSGAPPPRARSCALIVEILFVFFFFWVG